MIGGGKGEEISLLEKTGLARLHVSTLRGLPMQVEVGVEVIQDALPLQHVIHPRSLCAHPTLLAHACFFFFAAGGENGQAGGDGDHEGHDLGPPGRLQEENGVLRARACFGHLFLFALWTGDGIGARRLATARIGSKTGFSARRMGPPFCNIDRARRVVGAGACAAMGYPSRLPLFHCSLDGSRR